MPRPNVSAISNIIAPINADAGSKYLAFSPASLLAICGASSPIKPIDPDDGYTAPRQCNCGENQDESQPVCVFAETLR